MSSTSPAVPACPPGEWPAWAVPAPQPRRRVRRGLTRKQRAFVEAVHSGASPAAAYLAVFGLPPRLTAPPPRPQLPESLLRRWVPRPHPPAWRRYGPARRRRWEEREEQRRARHYERLRERRRAWLARWRKRVRWRLRERRRAYVELRLEQLYRDPRVRRALGAAVLIHPATGRPGWACRIRRAELPKHIREVKGGAYQARPWVGPGKADNVNLGLYKPADHDGDRQAAIDAAARAAREFLKRLAGPPIRDVWEVIRELQGLEWRLRRAEDGRCHWVAEPLRPGRTSVVPAQVLPPGVRRLPGGGYAAVWHKQDFGTFETPEAAWAAVRAAWGSRPTAAAKSVTFVHGGV